MKKTIRNIVTGGAGFLGSHLIDKLMENGEEVICLDNFFNTYPSNAMYTDSIAQYLVKKKAQKSLLLTGPLVEDERISSSFKESARKFGIKIYKEKFFVNNDDPRVRDKNNLFYLTKGKKYNNVFISDTDGEFALAVPNATMNPAIVSGSAGLIAKAWHWSYFCLLYTSPSPRDS